MIRKNPVVEGIWEAGHEVTPDISLNNVPSLGSILDYADGGVGCIEKLRAERRNASLVKLRCFDEIHLGIRVVNQAHPIARRAACMTSL